MAIEIPDTAVVPDDVAPLTPKQKELVHATEPILREHGVAITTRMYQVSRRVPFGAALTTPPPPLSFFDWRMRTPLTYCIRLCSLPTQSSRTSSPCQARHRGSSREP
jgi:hypothetical protein